MTIKANRTLNEYKYNQHRDQWQRHRGSHDIWQCPLHEELFYHKEEPCWMCWEECLEDEEKEEG